MKDALFLKGILYLALVPTLISLFASLVFYLSLVDISVLFVIITYPIFFYFLFLSQKNAYTDSEVLDMVEIPGAPKEIERLLKKRTRGTNRLINIAIISILGSKKTLFQTELIKKVNKRGINLTPPAITKYISELEDLGIIASGKGPYKVEYHLTPKGKWCYKVVRICFPKRFFFFIIRHYLKFRELPRFPVMTNKEV